MNGAPAWRRPARRTPSWAWRAWCCMTCPRYFETDTGDGFREPRFSKERRLDPQITIRLLTDVGGFPLMGEAFGTRQFRVASNCYEDHANPRERDSRPLRTRSDGLRACHTGPRVAASGYRTPGAGVLPGAARLRVAHVDRHHSHAAGDGRSGPLHRGHGPGMALRHGHRCPGGHEEPAAASVHRRTARPRQADGVRGAAARQEIPRRHRGAREQPDDARLGRHRGREARSGITGSACILLRQGCPRTALARTLFARSA